MQEAAGVFAELRDTVSLRVEAPRPVDLSPECAHMLERLCLAQVHGPLLRPGIMPPGRGSLRRQGLLLLCSLCRGSG